jgi:hypothetical protein
MKAALKLFSIAHSALPRVVRPKLFLTRQWAWKKRENSTVATVNVHRLIHEPLLHVALRVKKTLEDED